jgi:hypothetical protein
METPIGHPAPHQITPATTRKRRATMNMPAREEKLASFQQLTKLPGIQTAQQLAAASSNNARILIDHPHSYRDWIIVGKDAVPGFYHLESAVRLDKFETTIFELCLHESQFERV